MNRWRVLALAVPVSVLLLVLWQLAVHQEWVANLPAAVQVGEQLVDMAHGKPMFDSPLGEHIMESTRRVFTGFGIACLIAIAAFFPVLLNTIAGVGGVPSRLTEAAAMLGTRPHRVLSRVVLPAALPSVFAGMRIGLGFGWVIVVVGEIVGVQTGLGSLITQAWQVSRTDLIIAGMLMIGLAGFLADRGMSGLVRLSLRDRPLLTS